MPPSAGASNTPVRSHPSLRHLLVRRLLPAMLAILVAGAGTAYWVALHSANIAFDRSLLNTALAIAEQVRVVEGQPWLQMTPQAQKMLFTDQYDRIFFALRNEEGELLQGTPLPLPGAADQAAFAADKHYSYNARWNDTPLRIAALRFEHEGIALLVLVGETLNKRNAIVRDIVLGMLLPELLLIVATVVLLGMGIRSGLSPLADLMRQLAGRSQADLSPITAQVPEEMQALVVEINSLLRRLELALASQRNFVSDAAHQLRTPVAALQAQVEVAARQAGADDHAWLKGVLGATRRLSHLIDQLLALARAEPEHTQPMPELDLATVIHAAAETWLPRAIAKNVDLGFELAATQVSGNAFLLRELLSNLLDNAIRHTPEGGAVTVSCGCNTGSAWLAVEDSGPGIAECEREKVFERFYQPAGSGNAGCGLGLAIVRAIARQHGGDARAEAPAQLPGARIVVSLPLASCAE